MGDRPFDRLPMNTRLLRRPGRCPGLMACRPFGAETTQIETLKDNSPNGAAIHEPGASPRAVSGVIGVHETPTRAARVCWANERTECSVIPAICKRESTPRPSWMPAKRLRA